VLFNKGVTALSAITRKPKAEIMTQITQHQVNEGIRQAHIERSKALMVGFKFIRNAAATGLFKIATRIAKLIRPIPHAQN
jgi:hypothetical protein